MIERVARAIAHADEQNGGPPYEYRLAQGKHAKAQLYDEARAAIQAMREPTEAMVESGSDGRQPGNSRWGNTMKTWKAMIDEALK
jgi:hypothetical protein